MNPASTFELEFNDRGDTFTTSAFQLLQWKYGLKLEKLGMTMSGGKKVSTHLRKLMGLKRTTPVDYLIEWVTGALDAVNDSQYDYWNAALDHSGREDMTEAEAKQYVLDTGIEPYLK